MRILKKPPTARALLIGFAETEDAGNCVAAVIGAGIIPGGMEMMDRPAIHAAEAFVHAGYPLDVEALLIVELDGPEAEVDHLIGKVEGLARDNRAASIRISQNEAERLAFWAGRKAAFPAVGRISPDYYCMDGTIPRGRLAEVLRGSRELSAAVRAARRQRVPCRRRQSAPADPLRRQPAGRDRAGRGIRRRHSAAVRRGRRRADRRARGRRRKARPDGRRCSTRPTWRSSSASNAPSTRTGCSTPARCFPNCTAAPNWAGCTSMPAACPTPTCRGSDAHRPVIARRRGRRAVSDPPIGIIDAAFGPRLLRCARNDTLTAMTRFRPPISSELRDAVATALAAEEPVETGRRRVEARARPAVADAAYARPVAAVGHPRLRAERTGADRRRRDAARRRSSARSPRPGRCWRSSRRIGAACSARRRRADPGRRARLQPLRAAAHQGRRGARPFSRLSRGQRPRRNLQGRRQGGQERHRLRSLQADGRLLRHAGGAGGGHGQGVAAPGNRRDRAVRRHRARRCGAADGGGARLAARSLGRGLSAGRHRDADDAAGAARHRRAAGRGAGAVGRRLAATALLREHAAAGDGRDAERDAAAIALWRDDRRCRAAGGPERPRGLAHLGRAGARRRAGRGASRAQLDAVWFLDWGGGLFWVGGAGARRCAARATIRGADGGGTGHATLVKRLAGPAPRGRRCSSRSRRRSPRCRAASRRRSTRRHILNPGRMVEGG